MPSLVKPGSACQSQLGSQVSWGHVTTQLILSAEGRSYLELCYAEEICLGNELSKEKNKCPHIALLPVQTSAPCRPLQHRTCKFKVPVDAFHKREAI